MLFRLLSYLLITEHICLTSALNKRTTKIQFDFIKKTMQVYKKIRKLSKRATRGRARSARGALFDSFQEAFFKLNDKGRLR